jgi:ATP-dependent Lon protease
MTTSHGPRKRLPEHPSEENLRKQAKQLAKEEGLQLAAAQRRLATDYGYRNWAELMRAVAPRFVPLVPLRGLVAFPHEVYPIYIGRPKSIGALEAVAAGAPVLLVAQRDVTVAEPGAGDMYEVGTLCTVIRRARFAAKHVRLTDGAAKIVVEGLTRARVTRFVFDQQFYKAEVEEVADTERLNMQALDVGLSTSDQAKRERALVRSLYSAVAAYQHRKGTLATRLREIEDDPSILPYIIAHHLKFEVAEQQALLECGSPLERLEKILGYLEAAKAN